MSKRRSQTVRRHQTEDVRAKNPVIRNRHVISEVPGPLSLYIALQKICRGQSGCFFFFEK